MALDEIILPAVLRVLAFGFYISVELIVMTVLFGVGWFIVLGLTLGRIRLDRSSPQQRVMGAVIGFCSIGLSSLGLFLFQPNAGQPL